MDIGCSRRYGQFQPTQEQTGPFRFHGSFPLPEFSPRRGTKNPVVHVDSAIFRCNPTAKTTPAYSYHLAVNSDSPFEIKNSATFLRKEAQKLACKRILTITHGGDPSDRYPRLAMKITKILVPAMLVTALLMTADFRQADSIATDPPPASKEVEVLEAHQQQPSIDAFVGWDYATGFALIIPTSAPTLTNAESATVDGVGSVWVHSSSNTALALRFKASTAASKFYAKARASLNKYGCSSTKIKLNDRRLGRYANGMTDWYKNVVLLRSYMPARRVTYVVAHECMHMRQYRAYKGNVKKLAASMNRIYGGRGNTGLERNADCMTRALGIKITNKAYSSSCSGFKKTAALRVLKGNRA